jgi:hypothetical protein
MIKKLKAYEGYILFILILGSFLFTLGHFGYKFLRSRLNISLISQKQNDALVSELIDIEPTSLPEDTLVIDNIDVSVRKYISSKYGSNINDISVRVFQTDGLYTNGFYKTVGLEKEVFYLAYFMDNKWNVFYEGDFDKAPCYELNSLAFPVGMATDCLDTATSTVVSRL